MSRLFETDDEHDGYDSGSESDSERSDQDHGNSWWQDRDGSESESDGERSDQDHGNAWWQDPDGSGSESDSERSDQDDRDGSGSESDGERSDQDDRDGSGSDSDSERSDEEGEDVVDLDKRRSALDLVMPMLRELLGATPGFRVGGSLAAREEFGAERVPRDIDLEFWSYQDAVTAAETLRSVDRERDEDSPLPQLSYFLISEKEEPVSITVMAMGWSDPDQERPLALINIELNNENFRQGDDDFKRLPSTRHPRQPARMRRESIIAGRLERLSHTTAEGRSDRKDDRRFLEEALASVDPDERETFHRDVMAIFDGELIANPGPLVDEETGESSPDLRDHTRRLADAERLLSEMLAIARPGLDDLVGEGSQEADGSRDEESSQEEEDERG